MISEIHMLHYALVFHTKYELFEYGKIINKRLKFEKSSVVVSSAILSKLFEVLSSQKLRNTDQPAYHYSLIRAFVVKVCACSAGPRSAISRASDS